MLSIPINLFRASQVLSICRIGFHNRPRWAKAQGLESEYIEESKGVEPKGFRKLWSYI
jgi:hypothetical protein